jgi:hypothetical protein
MRYFWLSITCLVGLFVSFGYPQGKQSKPKHLFPITLRDKGTGFIDQEGKVVIEPQLGGSMYGVAFSEGLAPVQINGQWCYVDETGKVVLRVKFARYAHAFTEGLGAIAVVTKNAGTPDEESKWGFIDTTGKLVIKPQFDETYGFSEGLGRVVVNKKWGLIDRTGEWVVEPTFLGAYWFSEGFASVVLVNDQRVFIDHTGRVVSPSQYEYTESWFQEGLAPVGVGMKWGYINTKWQIVIEPRFDYVAQSFSDGVAAVRVGGLWGAIDRTGKFIIEPRSSDGPVSFSEGLAAIRVNGKYGYMDKTGKIVIEPQFEMAQGFRGGLAAVTTNKDVRYASCCWHYWDYIDKNGKYVWKQP